MHIHALYIYWYTVKICRIIWLIRIYYIIMTIIHISVLYCILLYCIIYKDISTCSCILYIYSCSIVYTSIFAFCVYIYFSVGN